MNRKKLRNNCIRLLCAGLSLLLMFTGIHYFWTDKTLEAEAALDTLPGMELLRDEVMNQEEPWRILEIVPDRQAAELGFYIGGQEPFECLWDPESGRWISWKEKLASLPEREERYAFMDTLKEQSLQAEGALTGSGEPPFAYEEYRELSGGEDIAASTGSFEIPGRTARGYFQEAAEGESGDWDPVFKRISDLNVPLEEINSGVTTPYYLASAGDALNRLSLKSMAESPELSGTRIYSFRNMTYFTYAGTAAEVWELIKNDVSGGNLPVSGNDISGGDNGETGEGSDWGGELVTDYYTVSFSLVNNVPENQVEARTNVYVLDARTTSFVRNTGTYYLVETKEEVQAGDTFSIPGEQICYQGGLYNAEVFRKGVLGLESEEELNRFQVRIDSLTQDEVNRIQDFEGYDMVCVGYGDFKNRIAQIYDGAENARYTYDSNTEQLSYSTLERLFVSIVNHETPCIADASGVYKLNRDNPYNIYVALQNGSWQLTRSIDCLTTLLMIGDKTSQLNNERTGFNYSWEGYIFQLSDLITDMGNYSELDGSALEQWDLSYVTDSVWVYNGDEYPFIRNGLLSDNNTSYDEHRLNGGFEAVISEIRLENLYREADASYKGPLLPEEIFDTSVFRYILSYANRRMVTQKGNITVLEIQPATDKGILTKQTVSSWTGMAEEAVTIETMPVTQFIGIIDDLNTKYDMIYFGSSKDNLHTQTKLGETITDFNDNSMDGMLYSHIGDWVDECNNLSGMMYGDYVDGNPDGMILTEKSRYRYPGNDLTLEKYNCLLDFLDAYYPVVVDSELVSVLDGKNTPDGDRIDNSSYLYEFLQESWDMKTLRNNVFTSAELDKPNAMFRFYINKPKLSIDKAGNGFQLLNTVPYSIDHMVNDQVDVLKNNGGKFYLQYRFTIADEGAVTYQTDYTCKLYLDANADGKFSRLNEEVTGLSITENGKAVDAAKLKAGVEYIVTRQVPDNYYGCITWQLEVQQTDNSMVRSVKKGYVKLDTGEATIIKVMQIWYHDKHLDLVDEIGKWDEAAQKYTGYTRDRAFHKWASKITDDYILDIESISRTEYERRFREDPDFGLDNYDMLIIGFSDGKKEDDWAEDGVIGQGGIRDFIESGKSVLLAHDTTSISNQPQKEMLYQKQDGSFGTAPNGFAEYYWGYNMNRYIRDLMGMDTYGITLGNLEGEDSSYEILKKEATLTPGNTLYDMLLPVKNNSGRYNYNKKDLAFTPGSNRQQTVTQVQGYTYRVLDTRAFQTSQLSFRTPYKLRSGDAANKTTSVERVNEGQITIYPFSVGSSIQVAPTHNQYYILDMNSDSDNDGQTDVVVWYTLTGGEGNSKAYSLSPRDVRNNYYIYNKGNITYTGMGHNATRDMNNAYTEDEAKLFLNTIIAAYQAGKRTPEITTLDRGGNETDIIYNYYDDLIIGDGSEMEEIYFRITDLNMTQGSKTLEVKYFVEDIHGEALLEDRDTPVREVTMSLRTYNLNGQEVDQKSLQTDTVYYVKVPASYFIPDGEKGNDTFFYIGAQTLMVKTTQGGGVIRTFSPWGYSATDYVSCELFDLD